MTIRGLRAPFRRRLVVAAVALELLWVLVDVLTPDFALPIAPYAIAPLLPAAVGLVGPTIALAVLSVVVAVATQIAHDWFGDADEAVRLATLTVVCGLAVVGARLRQRNDQLVQALDALPDAVTIQQADGTILYGNRAALRMVGEAEDGRMDPGAARDFARRWSTTDEAGAPLGSERLPARRLLAGERDVPAVVMRSEAPDTGDVRWSRVQASPLGDPRAGPPSVAVNIIEDITEVKQEELRVAFLAEAGAVLGSSLQTDRTLQRAADLAVPHLADWCVVDLEDGAGRVQLVALAHRDPAKVALGHELRERYPPDLSRPDGVGEVLRTGEPQLIPEIPDALVEASAVDAEHLELLRGIGFTSALLVPLAIGPRVIGALTWVTTGARRPYGPADLRTAQEFARRAAVAVENARVHTARGEIADVLQRALLPAALPAVDGLELATHYRAAGEANEVGGDFYDVVALPDGGGTMALVGDVAGKGARAAALTAQTRHTLVTATRLAGGDPAMGLTLLNAELQAGDAFELCSVALLLVAADCASATIVSAGHPLPLLVRDGLAREVGETSPLLGASPTDRPWTTSTVALHPGDLLLLYTDGVVDAVGPADRFGQQRLVAALEPGGVAPQVAIDRLVAALEAFEEGPQADDRALLALRVT